MAKHTITVSSEHSNITVTSEEAKGIQIEVDDLEAKLSVDTSENQLIELRDYLTYLIDMESKRRLTAALKGERK